MERSIRARDRTVGQLNKIYKFCETINTGTIIEELQIREKKCESLYKEFNDGELDLLAYDDYAPITDKIDDLYLNTMAKLKAAINSRMTPLPKAEVTDLNTTLGQFIGQQQSLLKGMNQTQSVRLPKVNIEPFAGDYKLWPSFHDLYVTSVHNNTGIEAVHKLQILNGLLRGDAAALIRHIKVTDQNYQEAWNKLEARYNKPKAIMCSLIQVFLDQKVCSQPNHRELRKLSDTSDEIIRGLRALGEEAQTRDAWLIHLLVNKVDVDTKQLWANESMRHFGTSAPPKHVKAYHITQDNKWNCVACKKDHFVYRCPLFKSLNVENRIKMIENSNSCINCLRSGHSLQQCYSRALCLICKKRHNSLLHKDTSSTNLYLSNDQQSINVIQSTPELQATIEQPTKTYLSTALNSTSSLPLTKSSTVEDTTFLQQIETPFSTILPTAMIYIQSSNGQYILARALLDSGSQSSFISESCIQRLGLRRTHSEVSIYGLATCSAGKTKGKTTITVKSRVIPHYSITLTALILERITSQLPASKISIPKTNEIWKLELADSHFNLPNSIDVLIGAEFFLDFLGKEKLKLNELPVLHSSKFGWLIAGKIWTDRANFQDAQNFNTLVNPTTANENLVEALKRFWQIEERFTNIKPLLAEDPCEILFHTTTTRDTNGKFIVRLPFKQPRPELGDSVATARYRMFSLEKKLEKSADFHHDYTAFIEEYLELGQMIRMNWSNVPKENNKRYFMPHHAVFKESSTIKMRVVFDASCKTTSTISLNDCLLTGPKLQPDLTTTLLRFRKSKIAMNADIEKMYRQILVHPEDANYQHILWRKGSKEELSPYKCLTVTYGTACAPFLAIRTLEELAKIYDNKYPEAAKIIRTQFYMDDLLAGSSTVEDAIKLKNQIMEILSSAGFKLRKWKSNSQAFLQSLAMDNTDDCPKLIEDDPTMKTLGISWHAQRDIFTFKIQIQNMENSWTKRKMLSESSKLYDPLGWLSPVIVNFKMLLQRLWLTKTDWDDEVPSHIMQSWVKIYNNLIYLQRVEIPRCLIPSSTPRFMQLHGFCDASESAYGCVVYLRTNNEHSEVINQIVCSKSKVAPIKQLSLPRLELCGALLLAELVKYCKTIFNIDHENTYAWTDSMVVLHWLSDLPGRWKTFIANRTSNILDIIPRERWSHICSKQNPADYISRGVDPKILPDLENWWHGPTWLKMDELTWPRSELSTPTKEIDIENRKRGVVVLMETQNNDIVIQLINNYSSWFKIKKIMAYILKFCGLPKLENRKPKKGPITFTEYVAAETFIIQKIQATSFKTEIEQLKQKKELNNNNVLCSLDPFIDSQGILRVGGRLRNAQLNYTVKHPIILPKGHKVNTLIVQETHIVNLHAGTTLLMNILRQKYWIIGVRYLIKRYIKSCTICIRYRGAQRYQKMADLPAERCNINRPFLNTGVDYLGPMYIKMSQHRNSALTKAYVALFVCLTTKAVHLEVVSNLSTDAFLAALKRFVSRRGLPKKIWCDNGSNFIGANNELKQLKKEIVDQQNNSLISNFILQNGIDFKFNPASAPHFGGLWEAAVKSVKYHFRRAIKDAKLNFEEMTTVLTQIESLLNSRPLCRLTEDTSNLDVLTPAHFLIGEALTAVPEPLLETLPMNRLSRWQNMQRRIQTFWKSWSRDYLNTLNERAKWKRGNNPVKIDDIVLIKEDNLPPNQWLLGRIIQVHPGSDGVVRVATVKTSVNNIKRPIIKLIQLPEM